MAMAVGDENVISDINVTPMVDVMLVLLIIFMVVTPAIVAGFQAQLPNGIHLKARPEKDERTVLGIDIMGSYYLNKKPVRACTMDKRRSDPQGCVDDVLARLQAEFVAHPEDKVLFIKADKGLKYAEMLAAMQLAKDAGAKVVAAVTEQTPGTQMETEELAVD